MKFRCSVVITTYNRSRLLARALESVLRQQWPETEVLVVDDASTDGTRGLMSSAYPQVRYLRQDINHGPSAARNRGLREAARPWVVFLDDDDRFLDDSLARIAGRIGELPGRESYPVFQFPRSNGKVPLPFMILRMEDYFNGTLAGDFVPVIRREFFLAEGLAYPEFYSGGEGMLWWRVAEKYGIPTWADTVQALGEDAPHRMMSAGFQIQHARDHAEMDERILAEFGEALAAKFPRCYEQRRWGAATYRMLAGDRVLARSHTRVALRHRFSLEALVLWVLSFMPAGVIRRYYALYKQRVSGWKAGT